MTAQAVLGIVLSGFGREAMGALLIAASIAIAFTISSLGVLLGGMPAWGYDVVAVPPGEAPEAVIALARTQIGRPYVWGGANPSTSFDCSGLTQWAFGQAGIALPRTAQDQFDATVRLSPSDLRPGDLVFFALTYPAPLGSPITHVGIYVGGGRMLNAPKEGDVVRESSVFTGYWGAHYAGAGRVRAPDTSGWTPVAVEGVQRPEQATVTTPGG